MKTKMMAKTVEDLGTYFEEAKETLRLPDDLPLVWFPRDLATKHGEIVKGIVYVYDTDIEEAKKTVLHELVELLVLSVNQAERITKSEKEAYYMKEAVIETLCSAIQKNGGKHGKNCYCSTR